LKVSGFTKEEVDVTNKRIRVLIAKVGLDGHDRGAKALARGLLDEGMEVIYTGLRKTPQQVVTIAIQEDVDAVLVSCHSGAHDILIPRIMSLLDEDQAQDKIVMAGGIIPEEDVAFLKSTGVKEVCGPGTSTTQVAKLIRTHLNV
jgi:methylmalonyl-CoA mutase, C-terminal domain